MSPKVQHSYKSIHGQNIDIILSSLGDLQFPALDNVLETEDVEVGNSQYHEKVPNRYLLGQDVVNVPQQEPSCNAIHSVS